MLQKTIFFLFAILGSISGNAQRGYFDAPYTRYEADAATLSNGAVILPKSYSQSDLQSEASGQVCVNLSTASAAVDWNLTTFGDGLVMRYSVPDGETATVEVRTQQDLVLAELTLSSNWSWEYLSTNGNPNNTGVVNHNPKMRFDEVRVRLPMVVGSNLELVRTSGNLSIDFIELEPVPAAISAPAGAAVYSGDGATLQAFINSHGGQPIFVPPGVYNVHSELYFGVPNTALLGAGMWHTQLHFTNQNTNQGGLRANATGIDFADLYLTTVRNSRSDSYKAINGVFTQASTITNIWAEHFECGAWIAQYNVGGPAFADGFTMSGCRFRNNYADGINLCKGTSNAMVEHCNFRNNGDDDQAIWCANGLECVNNTFRNNTSENCWRASGVAIYGGRDNKAYDLIIRDNLEAGIRISNSFDGVGFNNEGLHELHDITISTCGTFNDLYNQRVGAIDIFCASNAGTQVRNVAFADIDIVDSKNDAIFMRKNAGDGLYNLSFSDINIDGTGLEYPNNNTNNSGLSRGYFAVIANAPNGEATYCNMQYTNRGGNAATDENLAGSGPFAWTMLSDCPALQTQAFLNTGCSLYPNPVGTELFLDGLCPNDLIQMFDMHGKLIFHRTAKSAFETINVSALKSGIHLLSVSGANGSKTTKFIKS